MRGSSLIPEMPLQYHSGRRYSRYNCYRQDTLPVVKMVAGIHLYLFETPAKNTGGCL